ncbi:PspC domain-containing protein [Mangrovimonas sp. YM274]|uniref:PspC domain-containing protein n=1 Tax=Mangrovimonas sp. YM274 TaxID=3070660 RepID=UPI0027DE8422|nr:PspC domain-containing protein [Mangrovimonas sp. YM274]WMI67720.1 PspC domain-containing protein [Mangrovimonas sp. YM274]
MNKTVNINLAGIFFHIDEDAYLKLQRYLEAIKRSFTDSQGRSEIIADIEARIAELFNERVQHDKQVIGAKEVDEVIAIMGQPEDYLVDDEIFEDDPKTSYQSKSRSSKKLYRDTDNSYIGGVASGLGHYLGVDAVWIRLLWILLALGSGGTFIFIYILFWVLVPEAVTTAEKLTMTGEPVNISNIEKKIKDGFENVSQTVSDTVKNIDLPKQGNKIKSTSKSFFETIGDIIMFFLKIFAKFIGIILIIFGAILLFGLIISLFSLGGSSFYSPWWMDYPEALNTTGLPLWVGSVLLFLLFGIPLFFIFYLGLKILINNLKSIGNVAKFTLLGLWLLSLVSIIVIGITEASHFALENSVTQTETLDLTKKDTLSIKMVSSEFDKYKYGMHRDGGFEIKYNDEDQKVIFSKNVMLNVRSTPDSLAYLQIVKEAKGSDYIEARETAEKIDYEFALKNNQLLLSNYLHTDYKNKFADQNVTLILYLPEGMVFNLHGNTRSYLRHHRNNDNIATYDDTSHTLKVMEDSSICLDCDDDEFKVKVNIKDDKSGLNIDDEGVRFNKDSVQIEINNQGVKAKKEDVNVDISEDGIEITSDDN